MLNRNDSNLTCWFCKSKLNENNLFLDEKEVEEVFTSLYPKLVIHEDISHVGVCIICAGLQKYIAQDSVKLRLKMGEAGEILKDKASVLSGKLKSGASQIRNKVQEKVNEKQSTEE